ncbi:MAG: hypothetical protein ACRCY8_04050 [Dermatophilaceae bacterium]
MAVDLVRQVAPRGDEAARHLDRLLALKDTAHYGVISVSGQQLRSCLRHASSLLDFASAVARR